MSVQPTGQHPAGDAKHLDPTQPIDPIRHGIVYQAKLSDDAKLLLCTVGGAGVGGGAALSCMTCGLLCNILKWQEKLAPRGFVRIYENAIAMNYPMTCCFGLKVVDNTQFIHIDQLHESVKEEGCCTPFHVCCFFQLAGAVLATAPMGALNNCCCNCFRGFIPGLSNPSAVLQAIEQVRNTVKQGQRIAPGAMQPQGPSVVQMA